MNLLQSNILKVHLQELSLLKKIKNKEITPSRYAEITRGQIKYLNQSIKEHYDKREND